MPEHSHSFGWLGILHVATGYSLSFLLVPIVIALRDRLTWHRRLGTIYVVLMIGQFVQGVFFASRLYDLFSYRFDRAVIFACNGLFLVAAGFATARRRGPLEARSPIAVAAIVVFALNAFLFGLGLRSGRGWRGLDLPVLFFGALGMAVSGFQIPGLRRLFADPPPNRVVEHVFYMASSYFFLFTIISITHFGDGGGDYAPYEVVWLWPPALAAPTVAMLVASRATRVDPAVRPALDRYGVRAIFAVAFLTFALILADVAHRVR